MRLAYTGLLEEGERETMSMASTAFSAMQRVLRTLAECYLERAWVQAALDGYAILSLVVFVDILLGHPVALRLAYVAPIYFASRRSDKWGELIVLAAVVLVGAAVDLSAAFTTQEGLILNIVYRSIVFGVFMVVLDGIQAQLKNTQHMATHDILTGASNRLAIDAFLGHVVRKSESTGDPATIAMIDCDNFKQLNDQFGHAFGDLILITLVKQVRRSVPGSALVGRNGGDEFVVVFPGRDRAFAERAILKAAERFSDATLVLGQKSGFSYGIAQVGRDGNDVGALMQSADRDMYCRKAGKMSPVTAAVDLRDFHSRPVPRNS